MRKYFILVIIIIGVLLTGCQGDYLYEGDQINSDVKNKTDEIMVAIVEKIENGNYEKIALDIDEGFGGQPKFELIQIMGFLTGMYNNYDQNLIAEFHGNASGNKMNYTFTNVEYLEDFRAKIPTTGEQYMKFYSLDNGSEEFIIIFTLKKDRVWKLQSINIGKYKMLGLRGVEWYERAEKLKEEGFEIPAGINYLHAYHSTLIPMFSHDNIEAILDGVQLFERSKAEGAFPIVIESVTDSPEIHTIQIHHNTEFDCYGYTIGYLSKASEFNNENVKKEVDLIMEDLLNRKVLDETETYEVYAHKNLPIEFSNNVESDEVILVKIKN